MRKMTGKIGTAIAIWAAAAAAFHLYCAYIGYLEPRIQRSLCLLWFMPLVFIIYPASKKRSPMHRPSVFDWALAAVAVTPHFYSFMEAHRINLRLEDVDPLLPAEIFFGAIAVLLMLEALRRAVTPVLAGILAIILAYLFLTEYMPGMLNYTDMPFTEIIEAMYLVNGQGMYGSITGIAATLISIFISFGAFVEGSGVGRLFSNLGSKSAGKYAGGPAKVAVITSAMFGTMSGSSTSNVFTTGSFTIPMMKRLGYKPEFAGAVEVSASVGGQLMPPIMGVGVFVMSEMTNIPYADIIVAALLGAICYFFMIMVTVHLEAKKLKLRGMKPDELPSWREVTKDLHLLLPIFVLIILLMKRFSPHFAAFYAIVAVFFSAGLRKHTRIGPRKLFNILATAGRNVAAVTIACTGAGMVISGLTKTGLILSFGTIVSTIAGGKLWIAAGLLMITTLIMGMGMPTSAAYIITSAIGAPTLIQDYSVPVLAAHLFVFYFAILAEATPPVSIASYAGATIAKANPISLGFQALRLSMGGFVLGISYVYTQALMMEGPWIGIVSQFLLILCGVTLLSVGFRGYLIDHIAMPFRLVIVPLAFMIVLYGEYLDWYRIAVVLGILGAIYFAPGFFARGRQSKQINVSETGT